MERHKLWRAPGSDVPVFRCTRNLIWTTTLGTHYGARSLTLVTTTCMETVEPVNCGTFATTVPEILRLHTCWNATHGPRNSHRTILGTCRLTPLSARHVSSRSKGSSGVSDQHVLEISCASEWWNPCDDSFLNSVPMDHEERAPLHAHRGPSLWKKRAYELEGTQACIDRLESCYASQRWNPCDDEDPFSFREECQRKLPRGGQARPVFLCDNS